MWKMRQVNKDKAEAKILKALAENYPITLDDLRRIVKDRQFDEALKYMIKSRILELDMLPDKAYVRFGPESVGFVGVKADQKLKIKKTRPRSVKDVGNEDMYR